MSDRAAAQSDFLDRTLWAGWHKTSIAQDASTRSYTRLSKGSQSVILMDAPPSTNKDTMRFVQIAKLLQDMNLGAPQILAKNQAQGFLILEDLGSTDFAKAIAANPASASDLYQAAADVLIHLEHQTPPDLPRLDAETAGAMVQITAEHYALAPDLAADLATQVTKIFTTHCAVANTLALRDFHAENLIWRPTKDGLLRVGLLDFQDAFIAPPGYDLASLLRDARRDIDAGLATEILHFVAAQTGEPADQLSLRIRCLAVQRNLRILGVFARLIREQGKTRYAAMLPRVWRYLSEDLDHPAFSDLRQLVKDGLPTPSEFKAAT